MWQKSHKNWLKSFNFFAIFSPHAGNNGGTQTLNLGMMSRVLYHCATTAGLAKLYKS
jgi:hypothetical protein